MGTESTNLVKDEPEIPLVEQKGIIKRYVAKRLRRIMLYGDSHALRVVLAIAEFIMAYTLAFAPANRNTNPVLVHALEYFGPPLRWGAIGLLIALIQTYLVLRGRYNRADAALFAAIDAVWWIFITAAVYAHNQYLPATQVALTVAASWIFISSGFSAYGKRGTDYGDRG